ncbi:MAG TPA: (2Fe-2S)-binding protein, partial [Byssovorax sp.]
MFKGRRRAPVDPVTFTLDGADVTAERGEPLAIALLAADKTIVARSPKLHRPRGPTCFRGACDGCLARVDDAPNVMTCLVPARGGERVESQNVVGSRKADLLRLTDWFFPQGIDHHHLMAGVPALGEAMQAFAQKVAGLGRLPGQVQEIEAGARLEADVVVVGAGVAGMAVASALSRAKLDVALVDDGLAPGGSLHGAPDVQSAVARRAPLDGVTLLARHVCAGAFLPSEAPRPPGDRADGVTLLVVDDARAKLVTAPAIVLATGAHDGVVAAFGNDLPGVFSARALCRLLASGLEPDGPIGVVRGEGAGFWGDELARRAGGGVSIGEAELEGFAGRAHVSA